MTEELLIEKIRERHKAGLGMNIHAVKREQPSLLRRACRQAKRNADGRYLGWRGALELAGLDYESIRIDLLETIPCPYCKFTGVSLMTHLSKKHGMTKAEMWVDYPGHPMISETMAASRMGRSNGTILGADGTAEVLKDWEPLYSPEYFLDRVWYLHELGLDIQPRRIFDFEKKFYHSLIRYYGSFDPVYKHLGLKPMEIRANRHNDVLGREQIIEILQDEARRKGDIRTVELRMRYGGFLRGIRSHFGTMAQAVREAGVAEFKYNLHKTEEDRQKLLEGARRLKDLYEAGARDPKEIFAFRKAHENTKNSFYTSWAGVAKDADAPILAITFESGELKALRDSNGE